MEKVDIIGVGHTKENLEIGMKLKPDFKKICESLDGNVVYAHIFESN